jgi:glycosyltransferase involved in cell wall biosynthesis
VRWSIVTPSFRSNQWLKLCVASVADQGVALEHIVQDAGSDDGTLDWLSHDPRTKVFVERDGGMYDALNRGFRRSRGDLLAWLNCDEQYLPGALRTAEAFFQAHPKVDMIFADVVVVNSQGKYFCHRKMLTPEKYYTWITGLSTLSCGTFFRRRVLFDYGFFFDTRWRVVGDGEWMVRLLQHRVKMATLRKFTSVYTQTGDNLSAAPNALREAAELARAAPGWARRLKPLITLLHRLRRLRGGVYFQAPFDYKIYTASSPKERQVHHVARPISSWRME